MVHPFNIIANPNSVLEKMEMQNSVEIIHKNHTTKGYIAYKVQRLKGNTMEKVSVIMGIYNCESTLEEAIQSLQQQTFKDWKLIMVDDGSTDHTYEMAKKYAEKYNNIFVYKNKKNTQ